MSWTASGVLAAGLLLSVPSSGIPGDDRPLLSELCNPWEAARLEKKSTWAEPPRELVDPWREEAKAQLALSDGLVHPWAQPPEED